MAERPLRIAATADLHYGKHSRGTLHDAFAEISRSAALRKTGKPYRIVELSGV